jgi:hypothetical protein
MIPSPNALGELPPGIHTATLDEIAAIFARTPRRRTLFNGLLHAVQNLQASGVRRVFIAAVLSRRKPLPTMWMAVGSGMTR